MKYFNSDAEIAYIGEGLVHRTLPKSEWTHAAHFAAAFWLMSRPGIDPFVEMPTLIRAYNESTGTPNTDTGGYHETITVASLRVSRSWMDTYRDVAACVALNALLASEYGRSDWLLKYWSRPVLFSVAARRGWVDPDIEAMPF